ncbi:MAG: four helix bundle protein [Cyclobacteriaceae bacterium]|nr:four helix bundle protein [Cyclobacteriaceae bacterium]
MNLKDLRIYNIANEIGDEVWEIVDKWDYYKKDTIGKQFVRSADSISANIAEGYGRFHFKENKNFLYYSRGSAYETLDWLLKSNRRNIIDANKAELLRVKIEGFLIKLNAYIKSIGKKNMTIDH